MSQRNEYKMDEDLFEPENFKKIIDNIDESEHAQFESKIRDFGKAVALSAASTASTNPVTNVDSASSLPSQAITQPVENHHAGKWTIPTFEPETGKFNIQLPEIQKIEPASKENRDPRRPKELNNQPDANVNESELKIIRPESRLASLKKILSKWNNGTEWILSIDNLANYNSPFYTVNGKDLLDTISSYWIQKQVSVDYRDIKLHIDVTTDSAITDSNGVCGHADTKVACTDSIIIHSVGLAYDIDLDLIKSSQSKIPMVVPQSAYIPIHIADSFVDKHPAVVPEVLLHEVKHHIETMFAITLVRVIYVKLGVRLARLVVKELVNNDRRLNTILDANESLTDSSEEQFKSTYDIWKYEIAPLYDTIIDKADKYVNSHNKK